jgi:ubiquitin-activating enzyme E1-like protein
VATPSITVDITVDSTTGAQPTPPATLNANLISLVAAINPGYTAALPGSLIEDISSTDTYSLALIDAMVVELINSISPTAANPWLLIQQGNLVGVPQGQPSLTSVFLVFTYAPGSVPTGGFVVAPGVTVSDGTHQYTVVDGGVTQTSGSTIPLFCQATQAGSWVVPANTVNDIVTSVPGVSLGDLTCNNPNTGTPGGTAQTESQYRAQVLQAWRASAQGMGTFLKTLLQNVPGVQSRLVSVRQPVSGGWEVIVGGGDPYAVAYAIFSALFDISNLVGSTINVLGITNANPGVVTTDLNHGLVTGQNNVHIAGVIGMTGVNGGPYTVTVLDEKHFSFGVNTTGSGSYVSGGIVTPNNRNESVNLSYPPDTYTVLFVVPPQESVTVQLTWNTTAPNFVSDAAVAALGGPAIAAYLNSLYVGQPINQYAMEQAFTASIANILDSSLVSKMAWTVTINNIPIIPVNFLYSGDPESYFFATSANITVTQG